MASPRGIALHSPWQSLCASAKPARTLPSWEELSLLAKEIRGQVSPSEPYTLCYQPVVWGAQGSPGLFPSEEPPASEGRRCAGPRCFQGTDPCSITLTPKACLLVSKALVPGRERATF